MEKFKVVLESSELLDKYYDERALSCLPNGYSPFFQFSDRIDWGYDLIEMIDGRPSCKPIPKNKSSMAGVFHSSKANFTYIGGDIVITANIPAGTFAEGAQHHFSSIGIKDRKGNYVAMAVTQPVWIYAHRGVSIEIVIKTARSDSLAVVKGA